MFEVIIKRKGLFFFLLLILNGCFSGKEKQGNTSQDTLNNNSILARDASMPTTTNLDSVFIACKGLKNTLLPDSVLITCEGFGNIKLGDSWKEIERKVGRDQISQDWLFIEEDGEKVFWRLVTKLWKGTAKEIMIGWKELEYDKPLAELPALNPHVSYLSISNPKSIYRFFNGLRVGTTVSEVVKLNGGAPILFNVDYPCEEEYYLMDFNNGSLSNKILLNIFSFGLDHGGEIKPQKEIQGPDCNYCKSDDPGLVLTNNRSKISGITISGKLLGY